MGHSWELECEFWNAAESGLCLDGRALITKFPLCKQPPGEGCPTGEREGLSLSAVALCGMIMHGWNIVSGVTSKNHMTENDCLDYIPFRAYAKKVDTE